VETKASSSIPERGGRGLEPIVLPRSVGRRPGFLASLETKPALLGWLLIAPAFLLVVGLIIYPMLYAILASLYDTHLLRGGAPRFVPMILGIFGMRDAGTPEFLGFGNYVHAFTDKQLLNSVRVTLLLTVIGVPLTLSFAMVVALVLNERFFGRGLVRAVVLISWATPGVINALIWKIMLRPDGIVNAILLDLGIVREPVQWLFSAQWAIFWVIVADLWKGSPFAALILLAGLQTIPGELYEAAKIDGAGAWASFWYVTLPQLRYPITLLIILGVIGGLNAFELLYILTGGGPGESTRVIGYYIFKHALEWDNLGYSISLSLWLTIIVLLLSWLYLKVLRTNE
jgi:multiple sugar transport system permease protein